MNYYVSGFPCSDELYHTGIRDMKWYVRRFQNYDGTLTDAGYERYYGHPRRKKGNVEVSDTGTGNAKAGVAAAGRAIATAANTAKHKAQEAYRKRHPELMSDEELASRIARINMEITYKRAVDQNKFQPSRAQKLVQDIVESSSKAMASNTIRLVDTAMLNFIDRYDYKAKKAYEDALAKKREKRQEARDYLSREEQSEREIAKEKRQEARDIRKEKRQEEREERQAAADRARERDTVNGRFGDYVNRTMKKDFSKWTSDDWETFNTYTNWRDRMRQFEYGDTKGPKGSGGKKKGGR